MKPLQQPRFNLILSNILENKVVGGGPTNEYVYNPISLDLLANTMFLEAISLSCSHDSITKSIMSPLKVWLVVSNSWVCSFSFFKSFWRLSILHLTLVLSSLIVLQAASLADSKNVVCTIVLVYMQNPFS